MCNNTNNNNNRRRVRRCKTTMIVLGTLWSIMKGLLLVFRQYLDKFIDFIFGLYWESQRCAIPNLDRNHKLLSRSATSLAKDIREGKLKSEDLVKACIERIKLVNPIVNAVTDSRYKEALEEAREVDRQVQAGLSEEDIRTKPFLGVPMTCKESHAAGGMLHTLGLAARRHARAAADAECVRRARGAGALLLAVTNVPELNKWQETYNSVFGLTRNPFHAGRTVGGSSGGEAALAACMATPISLCSDIGGSTRMPAFYCGLFGHNPTAGTTSLKGSLLRSGQEDTMASIGFVAKHAEDLAPLTRVVAERADLLRLDRAPPMKDIKFYYVESPNDLRMSPICSDLRNAMTKVVARVSAAGAREAEPYGHRGFRHMFSLWRHWMTREAEDFARMLADGKGRANGLVELAKKSCNLSPYTLAAILKLLDDQVLPAVDAQWAEELTEELKQDLLGKLCEDGVLLFPSAPRPAPFHYSAFLRPYNFACWGVFNVLRCPATQVPLGLNKDGLPLGVQVVAAPYNDALCLRVAKFLEEQFGGFVPPCTISE